MRKDVVFSNAVAKAAETELLSSEALLRLSAAELSEAVKMLHDYGYDEGVLLDGSFDIDRFIGRQVEALISFVKEYSPSDEAEEFLLAPYLINNVKAEYKRKKGGIQAKLYAVEGAEGVFNGDYSLLNGIIGEALIRLDDIEADPYKIDLSLNSALYEYKAFLAKKSGSKLLRSYVKAEIDMVNLITALRAEKLGLDEQKRNELIIEGGNPDFMTRYEFDTADIVKLEAQSDNELLKIADKMSLNMDSIGPLLSYVLRKNAELKTVKMILVCIKSGARKEIPLRIRGLL